MSGAIEGARSDIVCPLCGSRRVRVFYEVKNVPASCNLLWTNKAEAIGCPKGNIRLAFCSFCTFITNVALEPEKNQYNPLYDNSLFYSAHFQNFAKRLATNLIQRYDLHSKTVLEVGCGKVDFLSLLSQLGNNRGQRFNPFRMKLEVKSQNADDLAGPISDLHPDLNSRCKADLVFSYHELEHANSPKTFLNLLHRIVDYNPETRFFFAVPNALKAFKEGDFTDIIYEHVSYFTVPSIRLLFSLCGFDISEVTETENEIFDSIYVYAGFKKPIKPSLTQNPKPKSSEIEDCILKFAVKSSIALKRQRRKLTQLLDEGKRVVIWGAGARGVTFLNIFKDPRIEYAVDINPKKQGMYVPGTGQKIVNPKFLADYHPNFIILANPAYKREIKQIISDLSIESRFILI